MKKVAIAICVASSLLVSETFNVNDVSSFRSALENASVNGESDEIVFEKGVYKTTAAILILKIHKFQLQYNQQIKTKKQSMNKKVFKKFTSVLKKK